MKNDTPPHPEMLRTRHYYNHVYIMFCNVHFFLNIHFRHVTATAGTRATMKEINTHGFIALVKGAFRNFRDLIEKTVH